jgi:chromosome segregation ATPase
MFGIFLAKQNVELNRRVIDQRNQLDKATEFEAQCEQLRNIEKEKKYFEEKCAKFRSELNDLKEMRAAKEECDKRLEELKKEREALEKKFHACSNELAKAKQFEARCATLEVDCKQKDNELNLLTERASFAESQVEKLRSKFDNQMYELREAQEQVAGENAAFRCEISSLKAQLANLRAENDKQIAELNTNYEQATSTITHLTNDVASLSAQLAEMTKTAESYDNDRNKLRAIKVDLEKERDGLMEKLSSLEREFNSYRKESESKFERSQQTVNKLSSN